MKTNKEIINEFDREFLLPDDSDSSLGGNYYEVRGFILSALNSGREGITKDISEIIYKHILEIVRMNKPYEIKTFIDSKLFNLKSSGIEREE